MGDMLETNTGNGRGGFSGPLRTPTDTLKLKSGEVDLWWFSPDVDLHQLEGFSRILSFDERDRAVGFRLEKHREQSIITRGMLKILLGRYLQIEPMDLHFDYDQFGKPHLDSSSDSTSLRFNLSHSYELALCAVAWNREVGVDVEWINKDSTWEEVSETFFFPREVKDIHRVPANERQKRFLEYWTCKEAYIKATGRGHLVALNEVEVFLRQNEAQVRLPSRLRTIKDDTFSIHRIESPRGYVAALAVEGNDFRIRNYLREDQASPE